MSFENLIGAPSIPSSCPSRTLIFLSSAFNSARNCSTSFPVGPTLWVNFGINLPCSKEPAQIVVLHPQTQYPHGLTNGNIRVRALALKLRIPTKLECWH